MSAQNTHVKKRNGALEALDITKIHKVLAWAAKDVPHVSVSDVAVASSIQFNNGVSTKDIHKVLIKTTADMISERTPNYQIMAARLLLQDIYKRVYGGVNPRSLQSALLFNIKNNKYRYGLVNKYTVEEIAELSNYVKYERDYSFTYAGLSQVLDKYLIRDKFTNELYETPQEAFMALAMSAFINYDVSHRIHWVKALYDAVSTFQVSLPTPIMLNLRTPKFAYSSCVTLSTGDTLSSWFTTTTSAGLFSSADAGIGWDFGSVRSIGSPVAGGRVEHTGKIPLLRLASAAVGACRQSSRGGSATTFTPFFDLEIETILSLRSVRLEEKKRIDGLDYAVVINQLLYDRALKNTTITLFSPSDIPEVMKYFYSADYNNFVKAYEAAEQDTSITNKFVRQARELLETSIITERKESGRIYILNIDEANTNSPFLVPIRQSNLCMEILLPTSPLNSLTDTLENSSADIGVCILANINMNVAIKDLPHLTELLVRLLDNLIDVQKFPVKAAEVSTQSRRSLGIGFNNYAYFNAKHKVRYGDAECLSLTHQWVENFQFSLIKASVKLAKEFGPCSHFNETTYSKGKLPIDRYNSNVDALCNTELTCDWESLREDVLKYGMRNSTLSAVPPSESSSVVTNATSGVEPIRNGVSYKTSKTQTMIQVAPNFTKLADKYDYMFDRPMCIDYLKCIAVMQKFICQSISANTFFNPKHYENDKVPMSELYKALYFAKKYGIKTLYYENTYTGSDDINEKVNGGCSGGGCEV